MIEGLGVASMNVLFISLGRMESIESHSLYPDLLRQFRDNGHNVYVLSQRERRTGLPTQLVDDHGAKVLYVRIGNITKCSFLEKGISTLAIESQYKAAVKRWFSDVVFDLVLYATPPITFAGVVEYIKKRDNAKTYLLLKDIFPQNAVDIGVIKKTGLYGLIYRHFRVEEKRLYALSDRIGCMSPANVDYVLKHNPEIPSHKVEVCPNCIDPQDMSVSIKDRIAMREKYGIPLDKKVFVYGGNLGKPQGIPFLIECLKSQNGNDRAYFLIVGDGTEYKKLENFFITEKPNNAKLMKRLPKEDYDRLVAACDVGLVFLDHRFTIPNFPSRLLSCLQAGLPVLCCTDPNTDIGRICQEGGFGWHCESDAVTSFDRLVDRICDMETLFDYNDRAVSYLHDHYTVKIAYDVIMGED